MGGFFTEQFGAFFALAFLFGVPAAALLFAYVFYQSAKREPPPPHIFQSTRDSAPDPFPSAPAPGRAPLPPPKGPPRPSGGFGSPPPHLFRPPPPGDQGEPGQN